MRVSISLLLATGIALGTTAASHAASLIPLGNSSADASSAYGGREAKYAVNGDGLAGFNHVNMPADAKMWMSVSGTVSGQWFRVNLGMVWPLHSLRVWNFNYKPSTDYTGRGIGEAEIYISTLVTPGNTFGDTSKWTRAVARQELLRATGTSTYTGQVVNTVSGMPARWLAMRVLRTWGDANYVGLSELQVFAIGVPAITNGASARVSPTQATLKAELVADGGQATTVAAFWGTSDPGRTALGWGGSTDLGVRSPGTVVAAVPVAPDQGYFYRFRAVNADGTNWTDAATFITGAVSVECPASAAEEMGRAAVTFRRPTATTNVPVHVTFGLAGTAVAGVDYLPPPMTAALAAGESAVTVNFDLLDNLTPEPPCSVQIGAAAGAYVRTAASTNGFAIVDADGSVLNTAPWRRHMTVGLTGYAGATVLTNFACLVRLHEGISGFRYADFGRPEDGGDLRVTDSDTGLPLAHEIDTWDPDGTSLVWVRVPRLEGAATTVRLHWGNAAAPAAGYGRVVWSDGFGGVWHLREPGGRDASPNGNHGAANGNTTVVGVLGAAQFFGGTQYIAVPDHASIGAWVTNALSVSTWFNSTVELQTSGDAYRMLEKGDDYFLAQGSGDDGGICLLVKRNDTVYRAANGAAIASNAWHHVCGTFAGDALRLYVDGALVGTPAAFAGPIDDDRLPLRIGSDDSGKFFKGALDELRVEHVARGADWIRARYDCEKPTGDFLSYGVVELTRGTALLIL